MANSRRVVVTGLGAVTPFGVGWEASWANLEEGRSGIRYIKTFDLGDMPVKYGGEIDDLVAAEHLTRPFSPSGEKSIQLAMIASREALQQARLIDADDRQVNASVGTIIGCGLGLWRETEKSSLAAQGGWRHVRPTTIP